MDILKRSLSPISDAAWQEIDEQARRVLQANLSTRKFVDVNGPQGWNYTAVTLGRLDVSGKPESGEVGYGIFSVLPLTETRIEFEMDIMELDSIDRGAKDIDFDSLDEAAKKIAQFEETAVYKGFDAGKIKGIKEAAESSVKLDTGSGNGIISSVSKAISTLTRQSVEGPYTLVTSPELWTALDTQSEGYPLRDRITRLLEGGSIAYNPGDHGSYLVSTRGGDLELTLGQDFSLGYVGHSHGKVTLFIAETFTFRVIGPEVIVSLT